MQSARQLADETVLQVINLLTNKLINDFKNNDEFSGWNWVGLVLGGLLLLLSLIGTFWPAV